MNDNHIKTLAPVHAFLEGTQAVEFSLPTKTERYDFICRSLMRFWYHRLPRSAVTPRFRLNASRPVTSSTHDQDGVQGLYHINAVDEVTRFEIVGAVEKISERYLMPILEQLREQLPFVIISFHAANGSEYINQHVVKLLRKLLIELTKSRARHTNDNALVESKNGSIISKHIGYGPIHQHLAAVVNHFQQHYLNPYINYHRPGSFPSPTPTPRVH